MLFYILLMLCLHMGMLFSAAIKPPISALSINTSSSSTEEKPRFEKSRLSAIALLQQVGYKTANLHELERFCTYFNNARYSYQVKIPSFCGISSHVIKKLLLEQGFDVATRWGDVVKHLISLGDGDGTEADDERGSIEFDMTLKFSAEFLEAQKIFERDLSEALDKLIVHIGAGDHSLGTMFENDKLDNLLKMASDVHEKMMVRSSGQEDSIDVSNAGGNVSVANVVAEKQVILKAMKEVILSYFGMKSLTQRLSLNDQTLLKSDVLMPVLIQKMIGEKRDSEIPRCGVMFSTDPEVRCKGISIIQSAYGHNEGVVNSLIPVDTYYAMRLPNEKMTFYPIIREKRQRLVPSETAAMLERQSNHKKLAENSSLNETELTILATFGQELEDYYGYGVDIEFVIKDKTIYIVQARPITHKNDTPSPSYVSASPRNVRSYSAATISSAGGSTRRLSPDSLLICTDTIGIALETYLSPAFDRVSVVAGVIGTMAPSLSHEVTIFRGKGKPIVFIKEWNEVSEALQAGQYGFLDVQQNQLLFIDAHSADEVEVKEGWINYPMPRQLSLLTSFFTTTDVSIEGGLAGRGRVSIKPWKELLDIMKKGAQPAVIEAAAQFCAQLEGMIKNNKKLLEFDQNLTAQAELIQSVAMRLCKQIVECSIYDASHEKYMHRLLVIRALESLLYQQFEQGIMQQHSIAMLHKIFSQEKYAKQLTPSEITFASEEVKNLYIQLVKIAGIAFSDAIKYLWLDFIKEAAQKSPSSLQDLAQLIKKLSSFNLLPIWVHTIFPQSILADLFEFNESFIQECITKWQLAFNRDNVFLDELKAIQHRIESINISVFGDQKRVGIAWNDFNEKILGLILRPAFFDSFKSSNAIAQFAACNVLRTLTYTFDQCIKTVKGSLSLEEAVKVTFFQQMLKRYRDLFMSTITILSPEDRLRYDEHQYLNLIASIVDKKAFTVDDLAGTPQIYIPSFVIGSGMKITKGLQTYPTRGEDAFSIIHQSLLRTFAALEQHISSGEISLPRVLEELNYSLKDVDVMRKRVQFIGTEFSINGITRHYNLPLAMHSCQFFVEYKQKTRSVAFSVNLYGDDPKRWQAIAGAALLVDFAKISPVSNIILKPNGVAFTFEINNKTDINMLMKNVVQIAQSTMPTGKAAFTDELIGKARAKSSPLEISSRAKEVLGSAAEDVFYWLGDSACQELLLEAQSDIADSISLHLDLRTLLQKIKNVINKKESFSLRRNALLQISQLLFERTDLGETNELFLTDTIPLIFTTLGDFKNRGSFVDEAANSWLTALRTYIAHQKHDFFIESEEVLRFISKFIESTDNPYKVAYLVPSFTGGPNGRKQLVYLNAYNNKWKVAYADVQVHVSKVGGEIQVDLYGAKSLCTEELLLHAITQDLGAVIFYDRELAMQENTKPYIASFKFSHTDEALQNKVIVCLKTFFEQNLSYSKLSRELPLQAYSLFLTKFQEMQQALGSLEGVNGTLWLFDLLKKIFKDSTIVPYPLVKIVEYGLEAHIWNIVDLEELPTLFAPMITYFKSNPENLLIKNTILKLLAYESESVVLDKYVWLALLCIAHDLHALNDQEINTALKQSFSRMKKYRDWFEKRSVDEVNEDPDKKVWPFFRISQSYPNAWQIFTKHKLNLLYGENKQELIDVLNLHHLNREQLTLVQTKLAEEGYDESNEIFAVLKDFISQKRATAPHPQLNNIT